MKCQKFKEKKIIKWKLSKLIKIWKTPLKNDKHNNKYGSCFIEENNMFYNNIVLK